MADGDSTPGKQGLTAAWKPGQSGNPTGRPKGSRNKLGEAFVDALQEDFKLHGKAVIATVRADYPAAYVRVIASLLPKQLEIKEGAFDGIGDVEIAALVAAARSALGIAESGAGGTEASPGPEQAPGLQTLQ